MKQRKLRKAEWREIFRVMEQLGCEDWEIINMLIKSWRAER
jgi:hypothetical protein